MMFFLIFRCAAPVSPCWFGAINMGGALHLSNYNGKMREKEKKEHATPSGSDIEVDLVFYKHAIPSGLV
jgi:hypothetical protein